MADSTAYARIPARPTTYKGIKMRSRLEAGYAAYLDHSRVAWEYEPECFGDELGQYLPDFQLGETGTFAEIKPAGGDHDLADVLERMHIIRSTHDSATLIVTEGTYIDGGAGSYGWRQVAGCSTDHPCHACRRKPGARLQTPRLKDNPGVYTRGSLMTCACCGEDYTWLREVTPIPDGGHDGTRLAVELRFSCEMCCVDTVMRVSNHKGYTMVGFTSAGENQEQVAE